METRLIKTKCLMGSRDRVGSTRKRNSRGFGESHILINILIKQLQPSNEGAPLHERIPLCSLSVRARPTNSLKGGVFALDILRLAVKQVGPASVPTVGRLGGTQIIVFMSLLLSFLMAPLWR